MTVELAFTLLTSAALIGLARVWLSRPPGASGAADASAGLVRLRWARRRLGEWLALGQHYRLSPRQMVAQALTLAALVAAVILALTSMPVLAIACGAVGGLVPTLLLSQRRLAERQRQIADLDLAIRAIRQLLEAGAGLEAAIDDVAHHGPLSLRPIFLGASAIAVTGGPRAGVEHLRRQLGPDATSLCEALLVAIETSRRLLPEVLKRIEEHHRQQREIIETTLAMQYRFVLQARTISLVPLAVLITMRLVAPNLTRVYETPLGVIILLGLLTAVGAGYWLMLRVGRVSRASESSAVVPEVV